MSPDSQTVSKAIRLSTSADPPDDHSHVSRSEGSLEDHLAVSTGSAVCTCCMQPSHHCGLWVTLGMDALSC
ncbi:Prostaglandin G/H Synthase 1 [Manis pentadactyla]|nr:Prostaglandin G/H Synthase 1 [Manis pentadactyla]